MPTLNDLTSGASGGYPDRVAALGKPSDANADLINQLFQLQQKQEQLRVDEQNVPNVGDRLKSLPGILAMLGTGVATAAGAPDLGAALSGGFVKGAMASQESEEAKIAQQRKETEGLIDAQRQRLTTLLQSRPEMFLDPKTGESLIDPRLIGYAATGYMMPINPAVNYHLTKQTERQRLQVDMGLNLMINGDTPEKRRQGSLIVDTALNLKLGPEFYEGIMGQDERSAWNSILTNQDLDITHSLEARVYALTHNKTLDDPEVVSMLRPATKGSGGELTMDKYTVSLVAEFNKVLAGAGEEIQSLPIEEQIDYVFKGERTGDAAMLKKFFMGQDVFGTGVSGSTIANLAARDSELLRTIFRFDPTAPMFRDNGITSEDQLWEESFKFVNGAVRGIQDAQKDAATQQFGYKITQVAGVLASNNRNLTIEGATDVAIQTLRDMRAKAVTKDGKFDVKLFNQMVNDYLKGGQ